MPTDLQNLLKLQNRVSKARNRITEIKRQLTIADAHPEIGPLAFDAKSVMEYLDSVAKELD